MNKQWIVVWGTAAALFGGACETDSDAPEADSPSDGGTDAGTDPNADGGGSLNGHAPQGESTEYLCTPGLPGACNNANDCVPVLDGRAKAASSACGKQCLQEEDSTACNIECTAMATKISNECASCFGPLFDCIVANCFAPCVNGTAAECRACTRSKPEGATCFDTFSACSGVAANPEYKDP